ncbi:HAD-IC family P-type ATPase [Candidatus Mycosynbacter amalyticus]|uniref:HAD-IC family P-type ATPase n=2 Tax=Candidatus Mycosynbacter amalyticus TaxID=2665156 RepID=A0A857MNP3_9BACT|nr:HAD-IC family P-type ATPase [Candidatus Mycosynbacter amalyticus]
MKLMLYHSQSASDVLDELKSSEKGLHQIYAEARLKTHGPNHLRLSRRSFWHIASEPFRGALMVLLLIALAISITANNAAESVLIASIIVLNASLRYWQSFSHEHTLRTLESEATGRARVRRDGIEVHIDTAELVPGDIVTLQPGDRIPADGRIVHSAQLMVNQLQLTGETEPDAKRPQTLHSETQLPQRSNMVYRGTYVVSGSGVAVITSTGNRTEYGKLLQRAARVSRRSSLQQKIARLVHLVVIILFGIIVGILALGAAYSMPFEEIAEYASAIIVAAVPAILAFAVAFVSTQGLRTLYAHRALVRHTHAIEPLSLISALVSDKTGMLTRDTISVAATWCAPSVATKEFLNRCQQATLSATSVRDEHDTALANYIPHQAARHIQPAHTFAFEHQSGVSGNLWHHGSKYCLVLKGAPEKILRMADLSDAEYEHAHLELQRLAANGHQVLAIAWCELAQPITKPSQLAKRQRLHFVGFVAFAQVLKPAVKHAVATATHAGISVRMVTGDHVETAYSIGRQLGIATNRSQVLDARKLAVMSDPELTRVAQTVTVFARTAPDQKHRLLSAIRHHHIVAATGDSTDDIPALIQAHIGISTAHSSLLARDASDLILLDNNFATTLEAIKWSRTIVGNIRRMFLFVITTNIAEMALIAGSLLLATAPALLPSQLLWINLIVSLALVLPLGLEPHSRHIMDRRPVSPRASVLPKYLIVRMCLLSTIMMLVCLIASIYYSSQFGYAYAQTIVFTMFVVMQIVSALSARSDHTSTLVRFRTFSPLVYGGVVAVVLLQLILIQSPAGTWLGMVPVQPQDVLISSLVSAALLLATSELLKWHSRHTVRRVGRSYA